MTLSVRDTTVSPSLTTLTCACQFLFVVFRFGNFPFVTVSISQQLCTTILTLFNIRRSAVTLFVTDVFHCDVFGSKGNICLLFLKIQDRVVQDFLAACSHVCLSSSTRDWRNLPDQNLVLRETLFNQRIFVSCQYFFFFFDAFTYTNGRRREPMVAMYHFL